MSRLLLAVMLSLVAAATASAQGGPVVGRASTFNELFGEANISASRGDHDRAIARYQELVAAGVDDPDLYFNLATAFAQAGDYPRAILFFERALVLRPRDSQTTENLRAAEQALEESRAEVEGEASIHRNSSISDAIYQSFTDDGLAITLLVANALFFGALAWAWVRRRRGRAFYAVLLPSGLLLLFCALGLAVKAGMFRDGPRAVVTEDRVELLEGPDPRAQRRGEARGGDRAVVVGRDGDFVKLRVIGGEEGWSSARSVGVVDRNDATH